MDRPRQSDCTAGQMDGEAGWWTTSGNIRLPRLARVMGVGRQQQDCGEKERRFSVNIIFTQSSPVQHSNQVNNLNENSLSETSHNVNSVNILIIVNAFCYIVH